MTTTELCEYQKQYIERIQKMGGSISEEGRISKLPKKKGFEACVRYILTMIDSDKKMEQIELLDIINRYLPVPPEPEEIDEATETDFAKLLGLGNGTGLDAVMVLRNLVDIQALEREGGGTLVWKTTDKGHPMMLGQGMVPRF